MSRKRKYRSTGHHRKPRSLGGSDEYTNISHVSSLLHTSWHNLFSNLNPQDIADIINEVWLDPQYQFICVRREPCK